jgi:conjugative transfer signal peptidase TraF
MQMVSRKGGAILALVMALGIAGLLKPADHSNDRLINDSASVPLGLWSRAAAPVEKGAVIGFRPPPAAIGYVAAHMPAYLHHKLILKYVVAMAGDRICREGASFTVDGRELGKASSTDAQGAALPAWTGCSTLGPGEVAVFSNRIPNSFDSRYYGAIPASNIVGVYRPVWTW